MHCRSISLKGWDAVIAQGRAQRRPGLKRHDESSPVRARQGPGKAYQPVETRAIRVSRASRPRTFANPRLCEGRMPSPLAGETPATLFQRAAMPWVVAPLQGLNAKARQPRAALRSAPYGQAWASTSEPFRLNATTIRATAARQDPQKEGSLSVGRRGKIVAPFDRRRRGCCIVSSLARA